MDEGGIHGFNAMPFVTLIDTRHLLEFVVPELRRRGRFRSVYRTGETLRERFFPGGGALLRSRTRSSCSHSRHGHEWGHYSRFKSGAAVRSITIVRGRRAKNLRMRERAGATLNVI